MYFVGLTLWEIMQLQDYFRVFRRRWVSLLTVAIIGLAAAAAFSFAQTPQYQARTQLFVSVKDSATAMDVTQGNSFAEKRITSYVHLATSPRVLQAVADELGIEGGSKSLAGKVTASAPAQTVLIDLRVQDANATLAAKIADSTAKQLIAAVDAVEGVSFVRVSVFASAVIPQAPTSPNIPANLGLGLTLGLLLGIAQAILRELLDTRLRSPEDISKVTQAGVLGSFSFENALHTRPLLTQGDPYSPRAEAFRQLRTHLHFTNLNGGAQSVVVSSSIPGEGKSSTSVNLAIMLAESGVRVLLVDADLRRPQVATILGLEGSVGLSTVLSHQMELDAAIQPWGPGGSLHVLTSGRSAPNPSELLGSPRMEKLLKSMEASYEVIIIDSPPLLPVTDPAVLGSIASGIMLVVSADGRTHKDELQQAIANIDAVNARLLGIVVNRLPLVRGGRGYYDYKPETPVAKGRRGKTEPDTMRHA